MLAPMRRGWALGVVAVVVCMCAAPSANAAFPGANGKIAYTSVLTGASTINPDGTGEAVFETGEQFSFQVESWSPDGTLMLGMRGYFSPAGDYTPHMLLRFPGEGGPGIPLGDYPPYPGEINREGGAWSPDGERIVYTGINVMNADGTNDRHLGVGGGAPAWSPDGEKIAFMLGTVASAPFGAGISLTNADGTGVIELTSGDRDGYPDWSPDGEKILFDAFGAVVVMNRDGSGRTTLVPAPQFRGPTWPVFSPDGTKIAWMNWSEAPENDYFAPTLWVADADGSNQRSLGVLGDELYNAGPSWQPLPIPNHPPDCTGVTATPNVLWPPNHRFRRVALSGASDPDGDPLTLEITGVTQNEPVRGRSDHTAPDVRLYRHRDYVLLRAERNPHGRGRVYTIAFEVSDGSDSCTGTALVRVPRHRR